MPTPPLDTTVHPKPRRLRRLADLPLHPPHPSPCSSTAGFPVSQSGKYRGK